MWKIENIDYKKGDKIQRGDKIRLKNLRNNLYLGIKQLKDINYLNIFSNHLGNMNMITMEKDINSDSLFFIENSE